jgi:hypothetical protein
VKFFITALLAGIAGVASADPTEQAIQRALIQRDQQSAEFAAQLQGRSLDALHARQLLEPASQFHGYDRQSMAQEREAVLQLPPPVVRKSGSDPDFRSPLPLPGGPRPGVDRVTPQSLGQ